MADPLVDITVVENLIGGLLVDGADKVEPTVRVYYPYEEAPMPDADEDGDTAIERWCRINPVRLADSVTGKRNAATDADLQEFITTVTCGVSAAALRTEPARLNQVAHLVTAALRGAHARHDATTHHITIDRAAREPQPAGDHAANYTAVVAIRGRAQRVAGSTATLNT